MSEPTTPAGDDLVQRQIDLLLNARFPTSRGPAYGVAEVDDYLDQLVVGLRGGTPLTAERLAEARFRMERGGYDVETVDRFLDELPRGEITEVPPREPGERRSVGSTIGWVALIALLIIVAVVIF